MGRMPARTNRSALAVTVRALREQERLAPADAALVTLATALAAKLDCMLTGDEKGYALAAVGKLYFAALLSLRDTEAPVPDSFETLLAELATPSRSEGWLSSDGRGEKEGRL
jgi:hypothetical protein